MYKELSPLEALKELKQNNKDGSHLFDDELFIIIEPALERLAFIDSVMGCVDYKKIADFLENCGCSTLDDFYKRIKALEIIKKKNVDVEWLMRSETLIQYNGCIGNRHKEIEQEEFDLLKEVL